MPVELTALQLQYIDRLLAKRHSELLHELHHAVTMEFKAGLKQEIGLTEQIQAIIQTPSTT